MQELSVSEIKEISELRLKKLLKISLGEINNYLDDPNVVEVMLNSDKKLWVDTLTKGMYDTGIRVEPDSAIKTIQTVASYVDKIVDKTNPILSAELPETGSRFEGILPPVVDNPSYTIRKKGIKIFTLDDYIENKGITQEQKDFIIESVKKKKNILIVGGTSTGKTTFCNAIINEISRSCPNDRIVILEETDEIQCISKNFIRLKTTDFIGFDGLLKSTMRLRPDRIIVGEIRDGAAIHLLTAWNSGHPGGMSTIHSDDPFGGLEQLEQYIQRVSVDKQRGLIARAINVIIVLERIFEGTKAIRRVKGIYELNGLNDDSKQSYKIKEVF